MDHRLGNRFTLDWGGIRLIPRRNYFSGVVDDGTILDNSLDQPLTFAVTSRSRCNTLWAQVIVAILANAAVVMVIRNGATTSVAINAEHAIWGVVGDDWKPIPRVLLKVAVAWTDSRRCHRLRRLLEMRNLN